MAKLLRQRWWIGLAVILIIAGTFRFSGYTFGLPYFENADEPWFYYEAAYQRGLLSWWDHPNPSPGLISLYTLAQVREETISGDSALNRPMPIVISMRFASVIASLVTLIFIGLCAREMGGEIAGWLAAGLWAIMPLVIYHSFIAIAEPWMMCFGALALYTAVLNLRHNALVYPLVSVWAGLFAFTFKYSMFSFAGIGIATVLWNLWAAWTNVSQRRHWLRVLALEMVSIVIFLAAMLTLGGLARDVSNPSREVAQFIKSPLAALTEPGRISDIVNVAFVQLGTTPLLLTALFMVALLILLRQKVVLRQNWKFAAWALFGALGLFNMLLVPFYLLYEGTLRRYLFSADLIFSVLAASSFILVFKSLYGRFQGVQRRALSLGAIVIVIMWLRPLVVQSIGDTVKRMEPFTLTDMTIWASTTLGEGSLLAEQLGYRAFNREFGGYSGATRVVNWNVDPLTQTSESWQQKGYRYLEVTTDFDRELHQSPEGVAFLQNLFKLRRFPPPESNQNWTGPSFIVYQLYRPQQSLDVQFGKTIHLVGVDGIQNAAIAGETLSLRFYWQATQTPQDNYSLFIHLLPSNERAPLIAQADGAPAFIQRPTLTWTLASETLVSETFTVMLPKNLATGIYDLRIGLYNPFNGQRLTTQTGDDWLLTMLTITH